MPEALADDQDFTRLVADMGIPLSPVGRLLDDPAAAAQRLRDYFGLATLDGLGTLSPAEIGAAALVVFYIERTQRGAAPRSVCRRARASMRIWRSMRRRAPISN